MHEGAAAFPGFLQALERSREPRDALEAALAGPLHPVEPRGGFIAQVGDEQLSLIADSTLPDPFVDRYRTVPIAQQSPITAALHHLDIVTIALSGITDAYPTLVLDEALWTSLEAGYPKGTTLITAPIRDTQRVVGVFGCFATKSPTLADASLLHGVSAALGLWFDARVREQGFPSALHSRSGEVPLVLTPRQREVLALIEQGKSNPVIAATLGFSVATVKAELARIMRMLRAPNRKAAVQTARHLGLLGPQR